MSIFCRLKYVDCAAACALASCFSCCWRSRSFLAAVEAPTTATMPLMACWRPSAAACAIAAIRSSYAATIRALRAAWNLSQPAPISTKSKASSPIPGRRSLRQVKNMGGSFVKDVDQNSSFFHWAAKKEKENVEEKRDKAQRKEVRKKGKGKKVEPKERVQKWRVTWARKWGGIVPDFDSPFGGNRNHWTKWLTDIALHE